jgi:hypothetical protein
MAAWFLAIVVRFWMQRAGQVPMTANCRSKHFVWFQ